MKFCLSFAFLLVFSGYISSSTFWFSNIIVININVSVSLKCRVRLECRRSRIRIPSGQSKEFFIGICCFFIIIIIITIIIWTGISPFEVPLFVFVTLIYIFKLICLRAFTLRVKRKNKTIALLYFLIFDLFEIVNLHRFKTINAFKWDFDYFKFNIDICSRILCTHCT